MKGQITSTFIFFICMEFLYAMRKAKGQKWALIYFAKTATHFQEFFSTLFVGDMVGTSLACLFLLQAIRTD